MHSQKKSATPAEEQRRTTTKKPLWEGFSSPLPPGYPSSSLITKSYHAQAELHNLNEGLLLQS